MFIFINDKPVKISKKAKTEEIIKIIEKHQEKKYH